MRALTGYVFCACAAIATAFSPIQQDDDPFASRPRRAPRPPAPVALPSLPAQMGGLTTSPSGQNRIAGFYGSRRTSKAEAKVNSKISELKRKLSSEDADVRANAEEELEAAVGELFDMRTNTRKQQIEDLEKRLATLRKQLEKREDNKSEIVRLHVKTMVNEAKGLGF